MEHHQEWSGIIRSLERARDQAFENCGRLELPLELRFSNWQVGERASQILRCITGDQSPLVHATC